MADVVQANADPMNRRVGASKPYDLHFAGPECKVFVGSNIFKIPDAVDGTVLAPFVVDGIVLLGFMQLDGHLLLTMHVFDEDNILVLEIQDNVLIHSASPWDIEFKGRRLRIREQHRKFLVDIVFEPPSEILIERGRFLFNGVEFLITPEFVLLTNEGVRFNNNYVSAPLGFVVGRPIPGPAIITRERVNRYLWDRSEVIKWAKESGLE